MLTFYLKILWLPLVMIFLSNSLNAGPGFTSRKTVTVKWAVQKSSSLRIQGSTNINTFGCDIDGYPQADTIYCMEVDNGSEMVTLYGELKLNISKFDCHSRMLTSDLRKTLKADQYPNLIIRFLSLDRAPVIRSEKDFLKGWVELELAGVCRRFEVCYTFTRSGASFIQLNGARNFSFADFKLTPPNKIGGLIKVKDQFYVDFNLLLYPVN